MDIVVHASLREGLARVLPQALAQAKPVISFDVDGAREVIINQKTGYLVPPQDIRSLKDAIHHCIENYQTACAMGQVGKQVVSETFEAETMNERIISEYISQLQKKGLWHDENS